MRKDLDLATFKQHLEDRRGEILADLDRAEERDGRAPVELDQSRVGRLQIDPATLL